MIGKLQPVKDTGPKIIGKHTSAHFLALNIGYENGGAVPICEPKFSLEDALDCSPREGMAVVAVLRAIAGTGRLRSFKAVATSLDAFLAQVDPSYEIPAFRRRTKQTTSAAAAQVFQALGIDRLPTLRSRHAKGRANMAAAQRERWRQKKGRDATPGQNKDASELPATIGAESNGGGE